MTNRKSSIPNDTSLIRHIEDKVYRQFARSLQQAMAAHNLPGFDLYEFHQIFKETVRQGKSKNEAFKKSVFASRVMRISRDSLIRNHGHYMQILEEEKKRFEAGLETFVAENIGGGVNDEKLEAVQSAFGKAYGEITSELKGIRKTLEKIGE